MACYVGVARYHREQPVLRLQCELNSTLCLDVLSFTQVRSVLINSAAEQNTGARVTLTAFISQGSGG